MEAIQAEQLQLGLPGLERRPRRRIGEVKEPVSEQELVAAAVALGARSLPGWKRDEEALAVDLPRLAASLVREIPSAIRAGSDPLGETFCRLRSPAVRRPLGATYTPPGIDDFMVSWAKGNGEPVRIVDPGAGSGRFLLSAASRFPEAQLVGVEIDPIASLLLRANLAAAGLADRSTVVREDYRSMSLPEIDGATLFLGNPPYVRHHLIGQEWKRWLAAEAARRGYRCSRLAGLHAHFFLATAIHSRPGDYGAFITASEWLDVNYGRLVRDLFLDRLGGTSLHLIEPKAEPFPDAATTGVITTFRVGARPRSVRFRRVSTLAELESPGKEARIPRERLKAEERWSCLSRPASSLPSGFIELGELFRVHRGQVTGANRVWIAGDHCSGLPESVLFPAVTKAKELLNAGLALTDCRGLRRVVDLPTNLEALADHDRKAVTRFLRFAKLAGAHDSYIARNRRAWWSVGLREPAPILATYMARRPPAFVRNLAGARHVNIAHGLYPREEISERLLAAAVRYLSCNTRLADGRTYAGGLTKFEPREMERLPIPTPEALAELPG